MGVVTVVALSDGADGGAMKYPVYRFSDVLRALRERSGLTVLEAVAVRWGAGEVTGCR